MSRSIVFKLFLLTSGLCLLVIAGIFIGQTVFFKQFYVHQKEEQVAAALQAYREDGRLIWAQDAQAALAEEQAFYQDTNAWLALVDDQGYLRYTDDYSMEIIPEPSATADSFSADAMIIPLYTVLDAERAVPNSALFPDYLYEGGRLALEGIVFENELYPQRIGRNVANLREENRMENERLVGKEYEMLTRIDPRVYREQYPGALIYGTVSQIRFPQPEQAQRYENRLFLERIKAFQADLVYGDYIRETRQVMDYREDGIDYKIFVEPVHGASGTLFYLFAMTSLQPVHEAVVIMQRYYLYIIAGVLLLMVFASLYFSRRIAAPLLRLDRMTQRMAKLDFSEKIPIRTRDEIGNLSANINRLSDMLHAHIRWLEHDIEREKRLEETRKQFISGVSHELKTPLSVLEGCLYILKDKPDSPNRTRYFTAMEEEVQRMTVLVEEMLELARYESGTYSMELVPVPIDEILQRVCAKLLPELAAKSLRLQTQVFPIEVLANPTRIEQVIINFMTNAIRYTPKQHTIIVAMEEQEDGITVSIENKGAHLPREQIAKIWDRFYVGDHSRQRTAGGTGLGLAISKQILEGHGVPYGVRNTEDGVQFYFTLQKSKG